MTAGATAVLGLLAAILTIVAMSLSVSVPPHPTMATFTLLIAAVITTVLVMEHVK